MPQNITVQHLPQLDSGQRRRNIHAFTIGSHYFGTRLYCDTFLACYDAKVEAIYAAETNNEPVPADKESMREARRGLFGFSLPRLTLFGNGNGDAAEAELVTKIDPAFQASTGRWAILLDGGARWNQLDTQVLARNAARGMQIKIRKASMGSYFANIDGQRAIRMTRVR